MCKEDIIKFRVCEYCASISDNKDYCYFHCKKVSKESKGCITWKYNKKDYSEVFVDNHKNTNITGRRSGSHGSTIKGKHS